MATFPFQFPAILGAAAQITAIPPDTDQYIYRYVTKLRNGDIVSEITQIRISQP